VLHAERVFVMGVIHDIGLLAICQRVPTQARDALLICAGDDGLLPAAEEEVLGYTHEEVGARLLECWGLPLSLQEVAGFHHRPEEAAVFPLEVAIVHAARQLGGGVALGLEAPEILARVAPSSAALLDLSVELVRELTDEGERRIEEVFAHLLAPLGGSRRPAR
jgi:HD-like signal output (HDOD) protein